MISASRPLLVSSAGWSRCVCLCQRFGLCGNSKPLQAVVDPANELGVNPIHIGSVVSLGQRGKNDVSGRGRVLMCASMTETNAIDLIRRVAVPLLIGMTIVAAVALLMATATV